MALFSTIACAEEHDTVRENFSVESGIEISVTLRCAWADRHDLVEDILANQREYPSLTLTNPPRAHSAAVVPVPTTYTADGQVMVYDYDALVTINYSTKYTDLISESIEPTVEFQVLDHRRFRWGSAIGDPLLEAEAPGRQKRGLALVRTYYNLDPPLPTTLLTLPGTCNDTAYTSMLLFGLTFGAETLMFQPPNISRVIKSDGTQSMNLTLKLPFKNEGWNVFWRPKTGTYQRIYDVETGAPYNNFPLADFSDWLA